MSGRFSKHMASEWMDQLVERTIYISLFTDDPFTVADPLTVEVPGGSSLRQPSAWRKVAPNIIEMANEVYFHAIPQETTLVAIGGFDAEVNGNLLFRDLLSSDGQGPRPYYMSTGGTFAVSEGEFVLGIDVQE